MSDTEDQLRDRIVILEERAQIAELKAERFESALHKAVLEVIERVVGGKIADDCIVKQMADEHYGKKIKELQADVEKWKECAERFKGKWREQCCVTAAPGAKYFPARLEKLYDAAIREAEGGAP